MRSLIVALIIHLTVNVLFFLKSKWVFKDNIAIRTALLVLFSAELLFYFIGFFFFNYLPDNLVQVNRMLATSWMLFVIYASIVIFIIDLLYLIVKKERLSPSKLKNQSFKTRKIIWLSSVIFVTIVMSIGKYKFNNPVAQSVSINIDKRAGKYKSIRIVFAADMHLGYLINRDYARKYVDFILSQNPDLILLGGDIIDSHIEPVIKGNVDEELRRLHAPLGVFTCPGNHEYRFEMDDKIEWLNRAGIKVLRDSVLLIDNAFYIVGREDFVIKNRKSLKRLLNEQQVDLSKPVIVLNHTPNNLDEEVAAGTDLALYGHTHNGQVFPGNLITEAIFEKAHGYLQKDNTHIYVTSGIALVGPQYRIGTVSEIAVLDVSFIKSE